MIYIYIYLRTCFIELCLFSLLADVLTVNIVFVSMRFWIDLQLRVLKFLLQAYDLVNLLVEVFLNLAFVQSLSSCAYLTVFYFSFNKKSYTMLRINCMK